MNNSIYNFYKGFSGGSGLDSLPIQTIPSKKKAKDKWKYANMDALESIGMTQLEDNLEFRDYYDMKEGRLVVSDYKEEPKNMKEIMNLRKKVGLPSYLEHYDITGSTVNQLLGEYEGQKNGILVTTNDVHSTNDFIREKTAKLNEYTQKLFNLERQKLMVQSGINTSDLPEFKDEKQKEQYLQQIKQKINSLQDPSIIQKELSKNFKVSAIEWAEETWEADRLKHNLLDLEKQEFEDYLLTGRFFRHYRVGYSHYEPERWSPITTFFSQDIDITKPQDGEYVGNIEFIGYSNFIQKYGSKLTKEQIEQVNKAFASEPGETEGNSYNLNKLGNPYNEILAPNGYHDNEINVEFQNAFNTPMGVASYKDKNGQDQTAPDWLQSYQQQDNYFGHSVVNYLRKDINPRQDVLRLTKAYWRSYQLVAYIYYQTPSGIMSVETVTDDIMDDFLKENNIKKLNNISIEEFEEKLEHGEIEENTICYTYIPQVWKGFKAIGSYIKEGIYFDIKPLEFQLKGKDNIYDKKLPVAGVIESSLARKLRPFQFQYNLLKNQAVSSLKKELGEFFLFDIDFLPSSLKSQGDTQDILKNLKNTIKSTGMLPVDFSFENTQGKEVKDKSFIQKQSITYGEQFRLKQQEARQVKMEALEYVGLTPQRVGQPDKYETAEGVQQGLNASYAQTESYFSKINKAHLEAAELHLNVAQYCETKKDKISVSYSKSDTGYIYKEFNDDRFSLRELGVLPSNSSKEKKDVEMFRNMVLQDNTRDTTEEYKAEILTSDTMTSLINAAKRERSRQEKLQQSASQRKKKEEEENFKREVYKNNLEHKNAMELQALENESEERQELIKVKGRMPNENNSSDKDNEIKREELNLKKQKQQEDTEREDKKVEYKQKNDKDLLELKDKELDVKLKQISKDLEVANKRNFDSVVNKN